jgi:hypothetical protein
VREVDRLCREPSSTVTEPAGYGHRRQNRQDFPDLMGCILRCRYLHQRGIGGTCGDGGHPAAPLRAEGAIDRCGAALGDHGNLVFGHCHMNNRCEQFAI